MNSEENEFKTAYPVEIIKDSAESLGISSLSEDAALSLAVDVEYRLREIIQESTKFMRHSKRSDLNVEDINHAIRVRSAEPVYGFNSSGGINFEKVSFSNQDLYFIADKEVDFDTLLATPLPPAPPEITFTAHWLAVEGVQPAIPQNPTEIEIVPEFHLKKRKSVPAADVVPRKANQKQAAVEVRPLVKQVLCRELRVYFERVASAVMDRDPALQNAAFDSLRNDPGLQQLLPHFIQFIIERISKSLRNLLIVQSMLNFIDAIINNPNFFIEPYLHQLVPSIMSCLLVNKLGNETQNTEHLSSWNIRRNAGGLIERISRDYGKIYPTLRSRLARSFLLVITDSTKELPSLYGAILGLSCLSSQLVVIMIIPNLNSIGPRIQAGQQEGLAQEASKVVQILVEVFSKVSQDNEYLSMLESEEATSEEINYSELEERICCPALTNALRHSPHADSILNLFNRSVSSK